MSVSDSTLLAESKRREAAEARAADVEAVLQAVMTERDEARLWIETLQASADVTAAQLEQARHDRDYLARRVESLQQTLNTIDKDNDALRSIMAEGVWKISSLQEQLEQAQARISQLERETAYFQSTNYASDRAMSEWEAETPLGQALDGLGDEVEP